MEIYIAQPGDTIFTIAEKFKVPYQRLIHDNNISPTYNIVDGQIIIITHPDEVYYVQDGDTLESISNTNGITPLQLIQNNPFLLDRDYLNIGEELIIRFPDKEKTIEINAYTFSYINIDILQKSLPFLTYLTIADYRLDEAGNFIIPADESVIEIAKEFGVAPIMMLSTFSELGSGSFDVTNNLLNSVEQQNTLIAEILYVLRDKELSGINFGFQYILPEDLQSYADFIVKAYNVLKPEGYYIFVNLIPDTFVYDPDNVNNPNSYIAQIGQVADGVIIISYQFTSAYLPDVAETTIPFIRSYTDYILTQIPSEKIMIGLTRIAYDWELPYVEGQSPVASLANFDALRLASDLGVSIGFDEYHITPYYYYYRGSIPHFVWFKDARTVNAVLDMINENNLKGISIWNVMVYTPQLWVALNTRYTTRKVLNVTSEHL